MTTYTLASYRYDAKGRRISKAVNGNTTYFLYDESGLLAEYDELGQLITEYAYQQGAPFMSEPLLIKQGNQLYFSHNDQVMASKALISKVGQKVWGVNLNGFEREVIDNPTVINNLRFPGQYLDSETDIYYNYYRDYDPTLGRYIQTDPIGLKGGFSSYGYARGNSVTFSDPYGLAYSPFGEHGIEPDYYNHHSELWGGKCGQEGTWSAIVLPDITPDACDEHDKCWSECFAKCRPYMSACRLICDVDFTKKNKFYGQVVEGYGSSAYKDGLRENGCDDECE